MAFHDEPVAKIRFFSCRYKIVSFLKRFCGGTVHEKRKSLPFVQQALIRVQFNLAM
jgi:hypothetical protein